MARRANLDVPVPAWFICAQLNVSKQTVNYWVSAGKLSPVACDGRGRPLYRYGDAVEVERETRRSGKSRRGCRHRKSVPAAA